ncbi:thiamine pyrophosphate-requiring protein [Iamia sp.]|uniref:thiamine pyrophosphate-requiring protein n=1 Tax=Iamia sp. TaxID=2722710 RepID=UPI002C732B88|nr:thiamine pyrophosphate-requiring protein [Iamia sp.]HXH57659.1 thiamine pyrophosphate-requiring protein [Iamia sp.]
MSDQPARTVADAVIDRLRQWGVSRVFGYSGDGINGVMAALQRTDGAVELVQARHEEGAALMASGFGKYTGSVGVVTSTQGPGAIHLLNGLYDAKLDHQPIVALVGQQARSALGSAYQQEIDIHALFKDVASQFIATIEVPEQVPMLVDRAMRVAQATRSPTCLIFPHDVQVAAAVDLPDRQHGVVHSSADTERAEVVPATDALRAAAEVLNAGRHVALLVGQGARGATDDVAAVAERLGAGVAYALLGKPVVGDDLPYVTGPFGHLGTTASAALMDGADTLLIVGSNSPWTEFLPPAGQARGVQIDIDGRNVGNRYPTEVNLVGDAGPTLRALLPLLRQQPDRSWRAEVEAQVDRWWRESERRAHEPARPLNPQLAFWELSARLPDDARLAVDVGSSTYWYARLVRLRAGAHAHLSSTLATMGSAMPYAVAAKLADPTKVAVALLGDGAMQMNGINELVTVSRMWRTWEEPRLPILVLSNGDLAEVSWEQREMEGQPRFAASQDLPSFPYASYARLLGLGGRRVDDPSEVGPAWDEAFAADRPFLIEAIVDPDVPLLPPTMPAANAEQMRAALVAEGDPGRHALDQLERQALDESNLASPGD